MIKTKRISFIVLLLSFALSVFSEGKLLVVKQTDGSLSEFSLAKEPVMTFKDQKLLISVGESSSEFEIGEVERFYFLDSSINSVEQLDNSLSFDLCGRDMIVIKNAEKGQIVRLIGIDGSVFPSRVSIDDDVVKVSLQSLSKGVYLIKIGNKTIKFQRK